MQTIQNANQMEPKSSVSIRKLISLYSHACIRSNQQINLKKKKKNHKLWERKSKK